MHACLRQKWGNQFLRFESIHCFPPFWRPLGVDIILSVRGVLALLVSSISHLSAMQWLAVLAVSLLNAESEARKGNRASKLEACTCLFRRLLRQSSCEFAASRRRNLRRCTFCDQALSVLTITTLLPKDQLLNLTWKFIFFLQQIILFLCSNLLTPCEPVCLCACVHMWHF